MAPIQFFTEDISFKIPFARKRSAWIAEIISQEKFTLQQLNYIFCSDDYLLNINIQYLKHNTLTDIITFDSSEEERTVQGDIYVSVDRVLENSLELGVVFEDELDRVLIHGVLHLIGYKDKGLKNKFAMRKKEDWCLSLREF